jgi:hypothetical protein
VKPPEAPKGYRLLTGKFKVQEGDKVVSISGGEAWMLATAMVGATSDYLKISPSWFCARKIRKYAPRKKKVSAPTDVTCSAPFDSDAHMVAVKAAYAKDVNSVEFYGCDRSWVVLGPHATFSFPAEQYRIKQVCGTSKSAFPSIHQYTCTRSIGHTGPCALVRRKEPVKTAFELGTGATISSIIFDIEKQLAELRTLTKQIN